MDRRNTDMKNKIKIATINFYVNDNGIQHQLYGE